MSRTMSHCFQIIAFSSRAPVHQILVNSTMSTFRSGVAPLEGPQGPAMVCSREPTSGDPSTFEATSNLDMWNGVDVGNDL